MYITINSDSRTEQNKSCSYVIAFAICVSSWRNLFWVTALLYLGGLGGKSDRSSRSESPETPVHTTPRFHSRPTRESRRPVREIRPRSATFFTV